MSVPSTTTIAEHLARRFQERGAHEGFGIVGDFALKLFARLHEQGFPILVTADEQGAAFAADAFARVRGFGVCAVTYSVGGLKVANAAAGAWAENVPLLILSGAPGLAERRDDPLLHHKIKTFDTQLDVYRDLTVAQAVLSNPRTAAEEIDRVIAAMVAAQRPGYIEVPRDMVDLPIHRPEGGVKVELPPVDPKRLELAVSESLDRLEGAGDAVAIAGVLAARRGLGGDLLSFAESLRMPIASTSLSKGIVPETHPLALGVYMGAVSPPRVNERVERARPLISFGVLYADLVMGGFTQQIERENLIDCTDTQVSVGHRTYFDVPLWAFVPALMEAARLRGVRENDAMPPRAPRFEAHAGRPLSVERVMACVASQIDDRHRLIVDPGDCLFASVELPAPTPSLASAYYATMGYAVPAALGAGRATPACRPVVLVGDGAFLMTALEALSAAYHGVKPIVVVVDNQGYGTQRPMLDGPFNDIPALRAEELPKAFGLGVGRRCETEDAFAAALSEAVETDELTIIRACVPQRATSPALARLTAAMGKRV